MNIAPSVPAVGEYFISRAGADKALAQVIAQIITEAGGKPFYQDETFGHADFMRRMEQGYERMARMVALLSPEYQKSEHCRAEYNHVLGKDPANLKQRLVVLRVADCQPEGNLQNLAYTDLVPVLTDVAALGRLVRVALGFETRASEIAYSRPYRQAGQQIRHPEVRQPKDFTGREAMLQTLGEKLWHGKSTVAIRNSSETTLALRGLGGVGKTVLAQAYAWQNRDRYHGVWWVRADKRETLIDDLVALGKRFIPGLDAQEPEDAAQTTLDRIAQMQTGKPWLLVYDNVDDPATIRRLTPPDNAHVLITTRLTEWHGEADELPVDVFDRETAIEFLLAQARNKDQQREAAGRLADALQRLPLALSHARSYCSVRNWSFDEYVARLPELIKRKPKSAGYPDTVFATFSFAIEKAAEECPEAERLMGLLAFFAPDQVPLLLIPQEVLGRDQLGDALGALSAVSLVTLDNLPDAAPSVSVHRLVQEVMRGRLTEAETKAEVAAEATRLVEAAYDASGSFDAPQRNTYLLPHALSVVAHAPREGAAARHTLWVLLQTGDFRMSRGETSTGLAAYRDGCDVAERLAKSEPGNAVWQRELSISLDRIGDVLRVQGKRSGALGSYLASLAITERLASADPDNANWQRDLSISRDRIGDVLKAQGKLAGALESYRASLTTRERLVSADPGNGDKHYELALCYGRVATVLQAQGNLAEALEGYGKTLAILERLASADPDKAHWQRDLSVSQSRIGDLLLAQGKLAGALESYRASLTIRQRLASADPGNARAQRDLSVCYGMVAKVLQAQGNLAEALEGYGKALAILERLASADPHNADWQRDLFVSHEGIGEVLVLEGKLAAALERYLVSLAIAKRLASADPGNADWQRDLSIVHGKIGNVLVEQGKLPSALQSHRASLAIAERLASADPSNAGWQRDLARRHGRVATVLARQGDRDGALRGFRQGREIVARLRERSPDNAKLPKDLAWFDEQISKVQRG